MLLSLSRVGGNPCGLPILSGLSFPITRGNPLGGSSRKHKQPSSGAHAGDDEEEGTIERDHDADRAAATASRAARAQRPEARRG